MPSCASRVRVYKFDTSTGRQGILAWQLPKDWLQGAKQRLLPLARTSRCPCSQSHQHIVAEGMAWLD